MDYPRTFDETPDKLQSARKGRRAGAEHKIPEAVDGQRLHEERLERLLRRHRGCRVPRVPPRRSCDEIRAQKRQARQRNHKISRRQSRFHVRRRLEVRAYIRRNERRLPKLRNRLRVRKALRGVVGFRQFKVVLVLSQERVSACLRRRQKLPRNCRTQIREIFQRGLYQDSFNNGQILARGKADKSFAHTLCPDKNEHRRNRACPERDCSEERFVHSPVYG